MARETRLWDWLRDGLKLKRLLHMRRVENRVSEGDPDVDGCWDGKYFELELKGTNRPKDPATKLDIEVRQAQVLWARRRWIAGGNVWVYVRVGFGADVLRYLVPGSLIAIVKDGVTEEQLRLMSVLPPNHTPSQLLERACRRTGREAGLVTMDTDKRRHLK